MLKSKTFVNNSKFFMSGKQQGKSVPKTINVCYIQRISVRIYRTRRMSKKVFFVSYINCLGILNK